MSRVLIFGSNGFVGGHLARELISAGYEVVGFDRGEMTRYHEIISYFQGSLLDSKRVEEVVREIRPASIINLAAISSVSQSWLYPQLTFEINVLGTINILEAVRKTVSEAKVLLIGSSEEYAPSSEPLSEESPVMANNPYGVSKVAQENIAQLYSERYDLRIYRTRSFNHIGPGQSESFVISSWCRQLADIEKDEKPGVIKVGNLDVVRDFTDVRDIVRGYRLLLESDYYGTVFNFGSGHAVSLRNVLEKLVPLCRQRVQIEIDELRVRSVDNPVIYSDCTKAQRKLGWLPERMLISSLKEIYNEKLCTESDV